MDDISNESEFNNLDHKNSEKFNLFLNEKTPIKLNRRFYFKIIFYYDLQKSKKSL